MSKIEVNQISSQCGSTLTVGQSGDTVTLAAGATQTGFGRTGTVNWNTTPITSTPTTGVNGVGYFIDSSGGAKTINLPASPSAGDIMAVSDYAQTAVTNNITIGRNGSNIQGNASDLVLARNGVAITLVYVDATKGWVVTDTGAEADKEPDAAFITATGGTITCCGDYKIHTFTGPGTFCVSCIGNPLGSDTVDYLVVAGGGSGGADVGGGGGAGGFRESSGAASGCYTASPLGACVSALPVSALPYPITVGAGAAVPAPCQQQGNDGSNSIFSTITSTGGGRGGGGPAPSTNKAGNPGGSGGGGGGWSSPSPPCVGNPGSGNTPPVSPPQGNNGGIVSPGAPGWPGAGGGGATAVGVNSPGPSPLTTFVAGGAGATTNITNSPVTYAAGGSGGGDQSTAPNTTVAPANSGGGGGGAGNFPTPNRGNAGGSGIVIIRYKYQ
jgi:hypothetical protein